MNPDFSRLAIETGLVIAAVLVGFFLLRRGFIYLWALFKARKLPEGECRQYGVECARMFGKVFGKYQVKEDFLGRSWTCRPRLFGLAPGRVKDGPDRGQVMPHVFVMGISWHTKTHKKMLEESEFARFCKELGLPEGTSCAPPPDGQAYFEKPGKWLSELVFTLPPGDGAPVPWQFNRYRLSDSWRVGTKWNSGLAWTIDLLELNNMVVGGRTGSGKSSFLYILATIALSSPDVELCTVDKDGALSAFLPDSPLRWQGNGPITEGLDVLEKLVEKMDERLALLRQKQMDKFEVFSPDFPLIFTIIDELAGFFAILQAYDLQHGLKGRDSKENRARALIARLMSEGRKAGFRTVLATQKPTVSVFSDGIRENAGMAVSFANEPAAVSLLIPSETPLLSKFIDMQKKPGFCFVRDKDAVFPAQADLLSHDVYKEIARSGDFT